MQARLRLLIGLLALVFILIAAIVLLYALAPAPVEHLTFPVTPTLLAPPGGLP
jgi:hypothetical protein